MDRDTKPFISDEKGNLLKCNHTTSHKIQKTTTHQFFVFCRRRVNKIKCFFFVFFLCARAKVRHFIAAYLV